MATPTPELTLSLPPKTLAKLRALHSRFVCEFSFDGCNATANLLVWRAFISGDKVSRLAHRRYAACMTIPQKDAIRRRLTTAGVC